MLDVSINNEKITMENININKQNLPDVPKNLSDEPRRKGTCNHDKKNGRPNKKQISIAKRELAKKCRKKDAESCNALGLIFNYYDKNTKRANLYFSKSCKSKNADGCFYHAIELEKINPRASKNILSRQCKLANAKSCRRIAGIYKKEKNYKIALKFYKDGCELEDAQSCHESSMLSPSESGRIAGLAQNCDRGHEFSCRILNIINKNRKIIKR